MIRISIPNHPRLAAGAGLVCLLTLGVGACTRAGKSEAQASATPAIPTVAVAKAGPHDLSREVVLTAEFRPFQEVEVMAKVSGYVKQIRVDVGDRVKQGELLATLEIPEMIDDQTRAKASIDRSSAEVARAKDEITRAESAHDIAHLSYQRLKEVSQKRPGLVAQQEIDDAQSKDLVGEAQVAAAKSNLSAAIQQVDVNKADLSRVNTMRDYTRVTAPFTGVITKRFADTGSMIQAGTASQTQAMPLVRLSENSLLRLTLPVPESVVPSIRVGGQVDVRVPSLNRTFPGKVARFSDKLQLSTRTMDTEVDVPNPSLILIPGMYAEVNLTLDHKAHALAIPPSAVDSGAEGGSADQPANGAHTGRVMVVTAEGSIEIRKVTIGLETANFAEILSGLKDGDLVVIGNRASLQAGERVQPKLTTMAAAKD